MTKLETNNSTWIEIAVALFSNTYNNFKLFVHWSIKSTGPGPTPRTVLVPGTTCVRPASRTIAVIRPKLAAFCATLSISSSEFILTTIFGCPVNSHFFSVSGCF